MKRRKNIFRLLGWIILLVAMGVFLLAYFFEKEKTTVVKIFESICCFAAIILFEVGESKEK